MSVPEAGALFGLGRTKSYEEARRYITTKGREGLPTIAFGRTLRCPTAIVFALLGIGQVRTAPAGEPAGASEGWAS